MKKTLYLLFILVSIKSYSQSVATNRCNNYGKGINLSNWMEAYWDNNWPTPHIYTRDFLAEMKNAGMKSVRVPICFSLVTDTIAPYTVDTNAAVFSWIDSVITWTHELDINMIIDNHHQFDLSDSTWRGVQPRLVHLWSVLAQKYRYLDPDRYSFEILNEPAYITNDSLNIMFTAVIDTIRKYTTTHSIVVSPNAWSGGIGYYGYKPLADTNLIYTFHSYDPFQFTHQGFTWVTPYQPTGRLYPNSGFDFLIPLAWDESMKWRDTFALPVFLGEFGVGSHPDDQSRCNWIDTMGSRIDYYHVSSFSWDVRGDFPLYKSGSITADSIIPCFSVALHLYNNIAAGIQNMTDDLDLQIFPNPAYHSFIAKTGKYAPCEIEIGDYTGQKIMNDKFTYQYEVDAGNWPRGIYFVKIKSNNTILVRKVVIE